MELHGIPKKTFNASNQYNGLRYEWNNGISINCEWDDRFFSWFSQSSCSIWCTILSFFIWKRGIANDNGYFHSLFEGCQGFRNDSQLSEVKYPALSFSLLRNFPVPHCAGLSPIIRSKTTRITIFPGREAVIQRCS